MLMEKQYSHTANKLQNTPLMCETELLKYNFRMAQTMQWLYYSQLYEELMSSTSMVPPTTSLASIA